jgi:hypothetical protein
MEMKPSALVGGILKTSPGLSILKSKSDQAAEWKSNQFPMRERDPEGL